MLGVTALAALAGLLGALAAIAGGGGVEVDRYKVGKHPISIAVGDFDRDGRRDLVVTNFVGDPKTISILRGRGQGRFARARTIALPEPADQPDGVEVTRIGKGKDQDLVIGTLAEDVLVMQGRRGTRFRAPKRLPLGAFANPREVDSRDFDHDGRTDLAVSRQGPDDIAVLLGEGGLDFAPPVPYGGAGGGPVLAAQLDPGNDVDLLTIDFAIDGLSLLHGEGDGTFGLPEQLNPGDEPISIAVADLNRDGRNDIVSGLFGVAHPRVGVTRGQAGGTFAPQQVQNLGPGPMLVSDIAVTRLNGDRDPDFVIVGREVGDFRVARGDPKPKPPSRVIFLKGTAGIGLKRVREIKLSGGVESVVAGRFDGGVLDAAVTRSRGDVRGQAVVILNP
jgi:hypothetical protein